MTISFGGIVSITGMLPVFENNLNIFQPQKSIYLTEKRGQIYNSISFDARDFKIESDGPNVVVTPNLRRFCVPRQFSPPTCRYFQKFQIGPLALIF